MFIKLFVIRGRRMNPAETCVIGIFNNKLYMYNFFVINVV